MIEHIAQKKKETREGSLQRVFRWLVESEQLLEPSGAALSWINPQHPGFAYPEATGYLLDFLSQYAWEVPRGRDRAVHCARYLQDEVKSKRGAGIGGRLYLFDSAVCLNGMLSYLEASREETVLPAIYALVNFLDRSIRKGVATVPAVEPSGETWSTSFGFHLLKAVRALWRARRVVKLLRLKKLPDLLLQVLPPKAYFQSLLRPTLPGEREEVYPHGFLYGLEGLVMAQRVGLVSARDERMALGFETLRMWQQPDGSYPNWIDPAVSKGREVVRVSDATAQALRLMMLAPGRASLGKDLARMLLRARSFLETLQNPSGALRYSDKSKDLNICASVFTAQGLLWCKAAACEGVGRIEELI